MIKTDLRFRIAAAITAACVVLVTIMGVILYAASEKLEESLVTQLVSEELNFLVQHYQKNPSYVREVGPTITYYVVSDVQQEAALPAFVRGMSPGIFDVDIGEGRGERHIGIREVGTTRYIVIYDLGPYEDREEEFKLLVAVLLLLGVLMTPFIGIVLSNLLVRQLTQLTQNVAQLSPDAPTEPLYRNNHGREVGILARTLDAYQARIKDMLQREQEFTADVSHELRTPLTEIRTSCELLALETEWSDKSRARIQYIAKAEQDMRAHMEALLFLGRDQTDASVETVALRESIEDITDSLESEIASKGLILDVRVDPFVVLQLNRKALHLVVLNLLKNAVSFTDAGSIVVTFNDRSLSITDTGVGIAGDDLPRIFDRHYRGSDRRDGFGLGLDIVKKICDREKWIIRLSSSPNMGTTFTIDF